MDASGSHKANQAYYDAFAERYEAHRGENDPGGYHDMLDELEASFVERYGRSRDVLEVGCGTGLVLRRLARFARTARGVDLSPGMLARAKERGLDVHLGSVTELPFPDATFDVTCAFKVLAHIKPIDDALVEMARVTRPGGHVLAEFYNPRSLRGALRRWGPAGRIAADADESSVFTRFDTPSRAKRRVPAGCRFVAARGIRIVTPVAFVHRLPGVGALFRTAEQILCDSPLHVFGGFWIAAFVKDR
jgi:ubiquinone/menaquinone biosynthesis C-methylase UbiE